jgi:hypothetical protein
MGMNTAAQSNIEVINRTSVIPMGSQEGSRDLNGVIAVNSTSYNLIMLATLVLLCQSASAQYMTLNNPSAGNGLYQGTQLTDIAGNVIVGRYSDNNDDNHSFLYSNGTFTPLNVPAATGGTSAYGTDGSTIVGYYVAQGTHGFAYNIATSQYTSLDAPADPDGRGRSGLTYAQGVSGSNIVGYLVDVDDDIYSFWYNGRTYVDLIDPLARFDAFGGTYAEGISGNNIVGYYIDTLGQFHGFLFNTTTHQFITLDDPLAGNTFGCGTQVFGIDGNNVVGYYNDDNGDSHSFVFNIVTAQYTNLPDDPLGSDHTFAYGIDGDTIVGTYDDSNDVAHGFVYQLPGSTAVPEPGGFTLALALSLSGIGFLIRRNLSSINPSAR